MWFVLQSKKQVRLCVTDFDNWMLEGALLAGVSPWGANKRKHNIYFVQKLWWEITMETVSFEPVRWWNQALTPHFSLSQHLCGGRKAGDQAAGQLRSVKEFISGKWGSALWRCCSFCIQTAVWAVPRRSWPFFQQQGEDVWFAWLRDAQYYPTLKGWQGGKEVLKGKRSSFECPGDY